MKMLKRVTFVAVVAVAAIASALTAGGAVLKKDDPKAVIFGAIAVVLVLGGLHALRSMDEK